MKITDTYNERLLLKEGTHKFGPGIFKKKTNVPPSVFIIGAQKAGTTSLLANLAKHPDVITPLQKELYYYSNSNTYSKGMPWYLKQFSSSKYGKGINIDATANYLESEEAPQRLHADFPEAKIIILLRNPTERAFSQYKMAVKMGVEKLPFSKALELEPERLAYSKNNYVKANGHDFGFQKLGYKTKGIYVSQLQNWLKYFDSSQIMLIQSEPFWANPKPSLKHVFQFLDLDSISMDTFDIHKQGSNETISIENESVLQKFYRPYNEELFTLMGQSFDW